MIRASATAPLALAMLGACGDNIEAAGDASVIDAMPVVDARLTACTDAAECALEPYRPICDPASNSCVECTGDSDCDARSLGARCNTDRGECTCEIDADCDGNLNGPRCHPEARACTCLVPDDCEENGSCELIPYLGTAVRTCVPTSER